MIIIIKIKNLVLKRIIPVGSSLAVHGPWLKGNFVCATEYLGHSGFSFFKHNGVFLTSSK